MADEPLIFAADGGCFGCSASNPHGLQLRFRRRGDAVVAEAILAERFHGAPGVAHGGIVAALLDEISCAAAYASDDTMVVTGELSIRYELPCPVEVALDLTGRVTDRSHPRYLVVEAEVRRDSTVLARSTGKFFRTRSAQSAP